MAKPQTQGRYWLKKTNDYMLKNILASMTLFLCASFFIIPSDVFAGFSSQEAPEEAVQAANKGLLPFLKKIPAALLADYGFKKDEPLEQAVLGVPFKLHTITPVALGSYTTGRPVESLVSETNLWYFPIMLAGESRVFLIVDRMKNNWQAVSLGQANLAKEIAGIRKLWPKSAGYNPRFIVVYQASEYLFSVPEKGPDNLTPIAKASGGGKITPSAQGGAGPEYSTLNNVGSITKKLKPVVEQNLKQGVHK